MPRVAWALFCGGKNTIVSAVICGSGGGSPSQQWAVGSL